MVYQNGGTGYVARSSISTGTDLIDKWKVFMDAPLRVRAQRYLPSQDHQHSIPRSAGNAFLGDVSLHWTVRLQESG